ncbi:hypothetical protein C1701_23635 [Actinoalloteichus sp. AHMU CJ021]|uniref:phosphatidylinositol-specific phospholipase C domain-containing protein n=1 Tax=Actinoalloteichus TaxID=65496 RepID=UPI00068A7C03|nr:phosphatidylinositol-specific phospholipase C domain-containing protein [Actinoalloteichus caeruleus]AUS80840.1 hypothetical protein C1701_23635 [Actinoalloteichus sp. AHMU CJ021]
MRRRAPLLAVVPLLLTVAATPALAQSSPSAAPQAAMFPATTSVGVHNAYEQSAFPYFADGLDSGAGMLEIDVWTDELFGRWRVSHDLIGQRNNCVGATHADGLRDGPRNQDLPACLRDIRAWQESNPGHRPIVFKVEFKDGFHDRGGLGPAAFDALVADTLGDGVFRPVDLLTRPDGSRFATLDEAALAGNWPSRDTLAGKVVFELIPGTFEQGNPFDDLWTDEEYSRHLRDLAAEGRIEQAQAFPAVLGAEAGDPRERYEDESLRPWFVFFDGNATTYVRPEVDTAWYHERNYVLLMTNSHSVAPAIDANHPTEQEARDRLHLLAGEHASIVSSDWRDPGVLSAVAQRGQG